jgi:hypothetical protein
MQRVVGEKLKPDSSGGGYLVLGLERSPVSPCIDVVILGKERAGKSSQKKAENENVT